MGKKKFFQNTAIVIISSLIFQTIGIAFRVYMSSKIGNEALGLYQLIIIVYMFVLSFTVSGISLATTRLITDFVAKKNYHMVKKTMYTNISISLFLSIILAVSLFFGSEPISVYILKDNRAVSLLKILSFSLPFVALSSCFRGYFYALRKTIKTVSEQMVEQLTEITVFFIAINTNETPSIEYACFSIILGTLSGEIISAVYSYILYKFDIYKFLRSADTDSKAENKKQPIIKKLFNISLPVSGNACLRSGLSMVENIFIPKGLVKNGFTYEEALKSYGMINGMAMPIINFPGNILVSLSLLLIPEISEANVQKSKKAIKYITSRVFGITFIFSIMVTGILIFFGKDLSMMLYSNEDVGVYMCLIAPLVPLTYLDSMVDAVLKGLNDQMMYLVYNFIDSVIRVILTIALLPSLGIEGLIIVIFVSEILNSTLSILRLMKLTGLRLKVIKWIIKPILAVACSGGVLKLIDLNIFRSFNTNSVCKILLFIVIYVFILVLSKSLSKEDVKYFKNILRFNH